MVLRPLRGRGRRNLSHYPSTNTQTARRRLAIRDWARLEQTRSELPLSRGGLIALGQSAPMAACFQLWSLGSQCPRQLRGDCSYRFDPRRLSSDRRAELPRLAPSKRGSEPQAQPPDRHSPPQSSRSGQASHQEEMGISISGAGVGRIEGRVSDCSVAVISMGRRNTYFS